MLDLEFCSDADAAGRLWLASRDSRETASACRSGRTRTSFSQLVLAAAVKPAHAILAGGDHPELATRVRELHDAGIEVL